MKGHMIIHPRRMVEYMNGKDAVHALHTLQEIGLCRQFDTQVEIKMPVNRSKLKVDDIFEWVSGSKPYPPSLGVWAEGYRYEYDLGCLMSIVLRFRSAAEQSIRLDLERLRGDKVYMFFWRE